MKAHSSTDQISIQTDRIIGKIIGKTHEPVVVFFAGVHGNEPAGVYALQEVFTNLNKNLIKGSVYGIIGNIKALEKKQRYIDKDLNRLWTKEQLQNLNSKESLSIEEKEQAELLCFLTNLFKIFTGPIYFIDFHTTSSKTLPFITINDALINRKFSSLFPVPVVLGIEEYLNGPLLSYINELGYVSLGFESGQHDEKSAILNSISFIFLALVFANILNKREVEEFPYYISQLKNQSHNISDIFEIIYLYKVKNNDHFKMQPDFKSFQTIKKGLLLAKYNNINIVSKYNARVFMPLYQNQGKEGFFIIKKIKPVFLKLSMLLRRFRADSLLVLLPGIHWKDDSKSALYVNLKVAQFLAKPIFHLLGYRSKQRDATHITLYNRERVSKTKMYKKENWYKKTT